MSIPGNTPYYVIAEKRSGGLIDYAVINPRGWVADEIIHISPMAAKDEIQLRGRIQNKVLSSQDCIVINYVKSLSDELKKYSVK